MRVALYLYTCAPLSMQLAYVCLSVCALCGMRFLAWLAVSGETSQILKLCSGGYGEKSMHSCWISLLFRSRTGTQRQKDSRTRPVRYEKLLSRYLRSPRQASLQQDGRGQCIRMCQHFYSQIHCTSLFCSSVLLFQTNESCLFIWNLDY